MKNKQVLDVKQMWHLQELGLDTSNASMVWCNYNGEKEYSHLLPKDEDVFERCLAVNHIPAYTLQDVLDALPNIVLDEEGTKYYLQIEQMNSEFDDWRVSYKSAAHDESPLGYFQAFHLMDAAVRMLVLCYEEGYVETNKNE